MFLSDLVVWNALVVLIVLIFVFLSLFFRKQLNKNNFHCQQSKVSCHKRIASVEAGHKLSGVTTECQGNDDRFSDQATSAVHTHMLHC